ncbi:hypothetical protein [Halobacillus sp. Cin3]|uniref:hypothetical protein n=1 Tax=Halobacillus sp. Cin3 TaxID=2928441 RepID=UPI00248D5E9D|nr:hypothetical protein [Halobacillus sp. Cin3]
MDPFRKKVVRYSMIVGICVILQMVVIGALLYFFLQTSSKAERYENYIQETAAEHLQPLDTAVSHVDQTLDDVRDAGTMTSDQNKELIEQFHQITMEAQKNEKALEMMLGDNGDVPTLEQTARQAKKYCNHFNTQMENENGEIDYSVTKEAEDFANHIADVADMEMNERDAFYFWEDKVQSYEEATYEFRDDYHFLDGTGFFEESNEVCGEQI